MGVHVYWTNFLPNGGNGPVILDVRATDVSGNDVSLGTRTINCDNAHAVKPFGAIDSPSQGGTASGSSYVNWGWVLTPQPNSIPTNGSTINVFVDGVNLGHPQYNIYRSDIAGLFPGYANTNGAVGYFYLDTTGYSDGVHTIQWTASDNAGNSDGIGSRYLPFKIPVAMARSQARFPCPFPHADSFIVGDECLMKSKRKLCCLFESKRWSESSFSLGEEFTGLHGYMRVGKRFVSVCLSVSTFDREHGIFYWQPGPGFVGVMNWFSWSPGLPGRSIKRLK